MSFRDKDDSEIPRREESLARRAGEIFRRRSPSVMEECPDLEVVAAYAEHSLEPSETAKCEGHFASCERCRNLLRAFAATADTPLADKDVAQLSEAVVPAAPATLAAPAGPLSEAPRPRMHWGFRWLAPALGVAAALALWFAVRPPWSDKNGGSPTTLVAQTPSAELPANSATEPAAQENQKLKAAPADRIASANPAGVQSASNSASQDSPAQMLSKDRTDASATTDKIAPGKSVPQDGAPAVDQKAVDQKKDAGALSANQAAQPAPPPVAPESALKAPSASEAEAKTATRAEIPSAAQPGAAAAASGAVASRDKQAAGAQASASSQVTAEALPSASMAPSASPEVRFRARNDMALEPARRVQTTAIVLKAPSGVTSWRAGGGGTIERSNDAGKTWMPQKSPSSEDWLTGHALSDAVCWLVGRKGTIARTLDGVNWDRIAPPVQAAGANGMLPDWNGVSARDYLTATVTASDGRKYSTSDGGTSWQQTVSNSPEVPAR